MEQVTPERADSTHSQQAFSLGPAAKEEGECRVRRRLIIASERGTQTTEGTTADRECAATATEKGEIQELKKVVGELLAQVQRAGVLAQAVAGWWTVASPEVAVEGDNSAERYMCDRKHRRKEWYGGFGKRRTIWQQQQGRQQQRQKQQRQQSK
jgi:hypothetical protein